jgi:hypothetical protein
MYPFAQKVREIVDTLLCLYSPYGEKPEPYSEIDVFDIKSDRVNQAIQLLADHPQSFAVLHTMCNGEPDCTDYGSYLESNPSMRQYLIDFPRPILQHMQAVAVPATEQNPRLMLVFSQINNPSKDNTYASAAIASQQEGRPSAIFTTLKGRNLTTAHIAQQLSHQYKASHSPAT